GCARCAVTVDSFSSIVGGVQIVWAQLHFKIMGGSNERHSTGFAHLCSDSMWIDVQVFMIGEDLRQVLLKTGARVLRVDACEMKWPSDCNQCRQRQEQDAIGPKANVVRRGPRRHT